MSRWALPIACSLVAVACTSARPAEPTTPDPAPETPPADCDTLRAEADAAARALATCREQAPLAEWAHRADFEWLDEHVGAHLEAARAGATATASMQETQAIADRVWSLLDAVREEVRERSLLDRTEDATEALMREHEQEARERALAALAGVLGALRNDLEPAPPPSCSDEDRASATAWMRAQAVCADAEGSELGAGP